jgi:hypothetical protein
MFAVALPWSDTSSDNLSTLIKVSVSTRPQHALPSRIPIALTLLDFSEQNHMILSPYAGPPDMLGRFSHQFRMPRGAPRGMKMRVRHFIPGMRYRMGHTGLASRSVIPWGLEPAREFDLDTHRHQAVLPASREAVEHAMENRSSGVSGQPAALQEVHYGRDVHPLCRVGCA